MKRKLLIITIIWFAACLLSFTPVFSQDKKAQDKDTEFKVDAELRSYGVSGNGAKAHMYRDPRSGLYGSMDYKHDTPGYFLRFLGTDIGYDTQHYNIEGGAYGKFKYWVDYNEILHNQTFSAKSPFQTGEGSGTLRGPSGAAASTNANTWANTFDYSTKRKRLDTGVNVKMLNPFFFDVSYNFEKKDGIKPTGARRPASMELPEPVDYTTTSLKAEAGYAKNPYFVSASYSFNSFRSAYGQLEVPGWTNAATSLTLPSDNDFQKLALKGSAKLPFNSKFSLNLSEGLGTSTTASLASFSGKLHNKAYDFVLSSSPLRFLEAKVYYKYHSSDNNSRNNTTIMSPVTQIATLFHKNETYGGDLGFRLPAKLFLDVGYKNVQTGRNINNLISIGQGFGIPYNTDNIYFTNLKWSGYDLLTARVGFERMVRSADYRGNEQAGFELERKAYYAAHERNTFKAVLDIYPSESLNFSAEYNYKMINYTQTSFGLKDDTRHGIYLTSDYTVNKTTRLFGYFDYENVVANQSARIQSNQYNTQLEETTFGYGLGTDITAIPKKLTFRLQGDYLKAHGTTDFQIFNSTGLSGYSTYSPTYIPSMDSYQRFSFRLNGSYNVNENCMLKAGYVYERYIYNDVWYDNYQYAGNIYLTGANSSPSYNINIFYAGLAYKFK